MNSRILEDLNKRRFNSPDVLRLIIFRVLRIVFFCLSLSFLLWFFLIQNYLLFTSLLGIVLGINVEMLINSRRNRLRFTPSDKESSLSEKRIEEETKVAS